MRKFQVGDTVRVLEVPTTPGVDCRYEVGDIGLVTCVLDGYPRIAIARVYVMYRPDPDPAHTGKGFWFEPENIELVRPANPST